MTEETNPYTPPSTPISDAIDESTDPQLALYAAVANVNAQYYLSRWVKLLRDEGDRSRMFHWGAFLCPAFWFPFRKMFRATLILYTLLLVEIVAEYLVCRLLLGREDTSTQYDLLTSILMGLICGFGANYWYYLHAKSLIASGQKQGLQGERLAGFLSRKGGRSFLLGLLFLFFCIGVEIGILLSLASLLDWTYEL